MKLIHVIVFLLIFPFASGLRSQTDSSRGKFPLHVGNVWQYHTYDYVVGGGVKYTYGWTTKVIGDTVMPDGKKYSILQSDFDTTSLGLLRQEGPYVRSYFPDPYQRTVRFDFTTSLNDTVFLYPRTNFGDSIICRVTFNNYVNVFGNKKLAWDFYTYVSSTSSFMTQTVADGFGIVSEKSEGGNDWFLTGAIINGVKYGNITSVKDQSKDRQPATFVLSQNYPNPFNSSTLISFCLTVPQKVEIGIYDMLGRRVTVLLNSNLPSGFHRVKWNGRSDHGQDQPSGVYFFRLVCGGMSKQVKMLMIK